LVQASRASIDLGLEAEEQRRTWLNLREALENHISVVSLIFGSKAPEKVVRRKKLQLNSCRFYTLARLGNPCQTT